MGIFKKEKAVQASVLQTAGASGGKHPFSALSRYVPLQSAEINLYKSLREAVPVIDAAICKTVRLIGSFTAVTADKSAQKPLDAFLKKVKSGTCSEGISLFVLSYLDQLLTYGTAVGEIVLTSDGRNIAGLYNASLEDVELSGGSSPLSVVVSKKEGFSQSVPAPHQELILTTLLNPEPGCFYGTSVLKGLPFVSSVLLKIFNTTGTNWERLGNVRFAVTYNPGGDLGERAFSKERAMQIASEWSKAMRSETVSDFVSVGDVSIKVIGADNQVLDSEIPVRQLLEQIIAKLGIPPFLLGLSWSNTERMSSQQADILTSELEYYRGLLRPVIAKICDLWLRLNGYESDFEIAWSNVSLQDEEGLASARLNNARAQLIESQLKEVKNETR